MAPNPMRFTTRSPPIVKVPAAVAVGRRAAGDGCESLIGRMLPDSTALPKQEGGPWAALLDQRVPLCLRQLSGRAGHSPSVLGEWRPRQMTRPTPAPQRQALRTPERARGSSRSAACRARPVSRAVRRSPECRFPREHRAPPSPGQARPRAHRPPPHTGSAQNTRAPAGPHAAPWRKRRRYPCTSPEKCSSRCDWDPACVLLRRNVVRGGLARAIICNLVCTAREIQAALQVSPTLLFLLVKKRQTSPKLSIDFLHCDD